MIGICLFDNRQSKKLSNDELFDNLVISSEEKGKILSEGGNKVQNSTSVNSDDIIRPSYRDYTEDNGTSTIANFQPIVPLEEFFYDNSPTLSLSQQIAFIY
jgi:hypothetical protein